MTTKLLTILPILFTACSADMKQMDDRENRKGRISIPLTASSTSGINYIVELPQVALEGEFDSLEFSLQEQTELDVSLQAGQWTIHIGEYALYQEAVDGTYHFVESELTSPNPQEILILADATTRAQLNFRVNNEEIITDGHLTFDINIDDGEQGDTAEDTGGDFFLVIGGKCDPCTNACTKNAALFCEDKKLATDVRYTRMPGVKEDGAGNLIKDENGNPLSAEKIKEGACNVHCIEP